MELTSLFKKFRSFLEGTAPTPTPVLASIPLSATELMALKELCRQLNLPMKDWLRRVVLEAAARQSQRLSTRAEGMVHAERAWAELDHEDHEAGLPIHDLRVGGHPCRHLRGLVSASLPMVDCQGICRHPQLDGRICAYPAGLAKKRCPQFAEKSR